MRTSFATQLFPKTTNIIAFAQTVVNAVVINIVNFAPQLEIIAITVELRDTLQRNAVSPKNHSPNHQNLDKQMSIRLIHAPPKATMKNLSFT